MARSNSSNNTLKYVGGSVAVIGVAFCIGYFVIGGPQHQSPSPENVVPSNVAALPTPEAAKPIVIARTPRTQNGEYTAPGAPHISISEERNPSLLDTSKQQPRPEDGATKPTDPEASQEAPPAPQTASQDSTSTDKTTVTGAPPTATTDAPPADAPPSDVPPTDGTPATATPPASKADPDTEQIATRGGEVGQEGVAPKAQFRVQAGSFVASENAKALADALHRRGYETSTRAERDGDKTVFRVQVGAYRTKSAADKAAQDLQNSGYPASVGPMGP